MPEGDVVWRAARRLSDVLTRRCLLTADLRHPRWATVDLAGRTVTSVVAHGKHLLVRTTPTGEGPNDSTPTHEGPDSTAPTGDGRGLTLHSHLRMDGGWWVYGPGERWRGPEHEIRVVLGTGTATAVGYRLHDLAVVPTSEEHQLVGHLGPDLLGPDWDLDEAVRRLRVQPERPIGTALLDQRNLAGIGNLYRAEVLFLRGVSPWTPTGAVPDLPGLVSLAKRLLTANRDRTQQSTTGSLRRGEQQWVYLRTGQPCRRCGAPVRAGRLGEGVDGVDAERTVYWCVRCQPEGP
ncbi:MAG TPA: DNA-formamidopyrimidine glycosylase family protein [Cryptosporangiaceae bacterium]|nr:DNA-formamidopyrimidine glycosylase family protein [Cryptosporangiaceae bacterium]